MLDLYSEYANFLKEASSVDNEPFLEEYKDLLSDLNKHILSSNELIEGSLFYRHELRELPNVPDPYYRYKRRNYIRYICTGRNLLEIGFNGGHSALLALTANKQLTYSAIDIGKYAYTHAAFKFLKGHFGNRIYMYCGDSRDLLPRVSVGAYDLLHIDGGHGAEVSHADLASMIKIANVGSVILFDDCHADYMAQVIHFYIISGHLSPELVMGAWENEHQILLRVNKKL